MWRPEDANNWTNGKALMATGSPFDPVRNPGTNKNYVIAECNNVSHRNYAEIESDLRLSSTPGLGLARSSPKRRK